MKRSDSSGGKTTVSGMKRSYSDSKIDDEVSCLPDLHHRIPWFWVAVNIMLFLSLGLK